MGMDKYLTNIRGHLDEIGRLVSDLLEEAGNRANELESLQPQLDKLKSTETQLVLAEHELGQSRAKKALLDAAISELQVKLAPLGIRVE